MSGRIVWTEPNRHAPLITKRECWIARWGFQCSRAKMYSWPALAYDLLIAAGRWVQAGGIFLLVAGRSFWVCLAAAVLLGLGTALVYPTLLAAVSDVAHPDWRASAVGDTRNGRRDRRRARYPGCYRRHRGAYFPFLSGTVVAGVMYETLPARRDAAQIKAMVLDQTSLAEKAPKP
jgi:MFS family permease